MSSVDLSIIIVNYRSVEFIRACLNSIYAHAYSFQLEVLVIDNASYDGCAEMIRTEFPQTTFLQSAHNLGLPALTTGE